MALDLWINGCQAQIAEDYPIGNLDGLKTLLKAFLEERAWHIFDFKLNGQKVLEAELPDDFDSSDFKLEISAGPKEISLSKLRKELLFSLGSFVDQTELLAAEFAKGQSSKALTHLQQFCEELLIVFNGLELTKSAEENGSVNTYEGVSKLLIELQEKVEDESWVDVSDLLVYELGPILSEWQLEKV